MNLRRIFANALARRVAYVLVALVLAWFGLGDARAACTPYGTFGAICGYRGEAYAWAQSMGPPAGATNWGCTSAQPSLGPPHKVLLISARETSGEYQVVHLCQGGREGLNLGSVKWEVATCPPGATWDPDTNTCGTCADKPHLGAGAWSNVQGGKMCKDGCEYEGGISPGGGVGVCFDTVIDGQRYTHCTGWGPTGSQCTVDGPGGFPGTPSEAPPDSDGDGTSDDFDSAPNNPGRGGSGPDGEPTQEDGDCGGIGQPECGALGSGSGNGNTSGGGGDCNTPPSSTGDPILAQIAFQTWATRCAVEGNANAGPGSGSGDGGEGLLDQLRAEAAGLDQSLGEGDADAAWIEGPTTLDLDTGGLGIGGTCPAPPTVNGVSIDPDGNLCMLVQIIGALVLVGAYVHAGYIIGRA